MSIGILILNFIRKNWVPILIAGIIFSVFSYILILKNQISEYKLDILRKNIEISTCKVNISDRNKIIESWSKQSELQNREMENIKSEISNLSIDTKRQIKNILDKKAPETCDETISYLINIGKDYE